MIKKSSLQDRVPIRFLTFALIFTVVITSGLVWHNYNSYRDAESEQEQQWRIGESYRQMLRLGEVITMSARMAVTTGDEAWVKRFGYFAPRLSGAIQEALNQTSDPSGREAVKQMSQTSMRMIQMTTQAFNLMKVGNQTGAKEILFGEDYIGQKQIYARALSQFTATRQSSARLHEIADMINYFDEVLTMSAMMAAATGDLGWEDKYRQNQQQLKSAIDQTIALAPQMHIREAAIQISESSAELAKMEDQAFDLIRRGKIEDANALLFGRDYEVQKKIYAGGIQWFTSLLDEEAIHRLDKGRNQTLLVILAFIFLLFVLILAWFIVLKSIHRWQLLLVDRNKQLSELNQSLDERVSERTAELERTNRELREENERRQKIEEELKQRAVELEEARKEVLQILEDLEKEKKDRQLILDSAGEGICGVDHEGKITFVNPAALKMLGYEAESDLIGLPEHEVIHHTRFDATPNLVEHCPIHASIKNGTIQRATDELFWRKDASNFHVEYITTHILGFFSSGFSSSGLILMSSAPSAFARSVKFRSISP